MIRETGYLKFTGVVKAEQNNFAGIGAVGDGAQGATFSSESEGVLGDVEALINISIGSLFGPFIGVSLGLLAVQHAPTGIVSTITSITPILIIPVAIIFLKEKVMPREIVGAIISLGGVSLLFVKL